MNIIQSIVTLLILIGLLTILITVTNFNSLNSSKPNSSPFECGFSNLVNSGTVPFSLPFFAISLIFLIFDVEIILICFFPLSNVINIPLSPQFWTLTLIILIATLYEWNKGLISWL